MTEHFLIKHHSSGKYLIPNGTENNPPDETRIVLQQRSKPIKRMHFVFKPVTDRWGYIEHVASSKIIIPLDGDLKPKDGTELMLQRNRHWGALFAIDAANDHIEHKGGKCAYPEGGSPNPEDGTVVVLSSDESDTNRFQFVSPENVDKEVLVYGNPLVLGKWNIINLVRNPLAEHVDTLQVKMGKSTSESSRRSFQFQWELSEGVDIEMLKMSASVKLQGMIEKTSTATWSSETTHARQIRVSPGETVATWQYVFYIQQEKYKTVFQSNFLADTNSETSPPENVHY